jgi:cell division protein FtsN
MLQERRQHQRLTPNTPQLVLLDESKYSLLFDVGEGGLAIEGFAAQKPRDEFSVEFDLPEGNGCIQARAQVVWTSDSGYRTGFRFLDLDDPHREQLRNWIAAAESSRISVVEARVAQPTSLQNDEDTDVLGNQPGDKRSVEKVQGGISLFPVPRPSAERVEAQSEHASHTPLYRAGFVLALVLSSLAFFIGYYWRAAHSRAHALAQRPAPSQMAASPAPAVPPVPVPEPPIPGAPAVSEPGFVLQVAAMASEANADGLSASLHKKSFPAFVFKRDPDRLYRVVVGPFPTQEAAAKAETQLKAQDFKPLLRPWSPE